MQSVGKLMVMFGVVLAAAGVMMMFMDKIPLVGKLPGDITIKKENFQFYFPVTTSIVVSIVISLVLWLVSAMSKK